MKSVVWTLLFTLALTLVLFAETGNIDGNWSVKQIGGVRTKTIGGAEFEFKADGDKLTGMAHVGNEETSYYPGKAPISKGRIEGDRISFAVYGQHPSSSGFPTMEFVGTIHGEEIKLAMVLYNGEVRPQNVLNMEFEGKRVSTK
jgi:hypothetical protein